MKLQVDYFNAQGNKLGMEIVLPDNLSEALCPTTYAKVVRGLLNHLRQATSSTKTRGEVNFANRKPWKQKGTGRARVSSARSPLWRKGGIMFGPRPGCTELKINVKERKQALGWLVRERLNNGDFCCLELPQEVSLLKTAAVAETLKNAGLHTQSRVTFMLSSDDIVTFNAVKNLENVEIVFFDQLGILELSRKGKFAFLMKDKDVMVEALGQWT